jgi:hypothetical protein
MKKAKPQAAASAAPQAASANDSQNTLLGDLESIRSLLDLSTAPPVADDEGNDVPMLEDAIDGAFTVNESILTSRTTIDDSGGASHNSGDGGESGLADDTIKALLGDEWRSAARQILAEARSTGDGAGRVWSAQQSRTLNESLKLRIDHTVDDWLTEVMHARIDELRSRLLAVLEREIDQLTRTDDER